MKAMQLSRSAPVEQAPLTLVDLSPPTPAGDELLVRVQACGVCHTDLHIVEGEVPTDRPIVPGHQVVGTVERIGAKATGWKPGDRVGIPWLHRTCRQCGFCATDRENLCDVARFTGKHVNGGYAEYAIVVAEYAVRLPDALDDVHAAPLLCAGIVGYRALRLSDIQQGRPLGLYGFGASAHLAIQVAVHWGCEVFVATRSREHQQLAKQLGAAWVGEADAVPSAALDAAVMFAPAGRLVPPALRALRKGGTLALAGIYMSAIPELDYDRLYHERTIRSVANATRADARAFMELAGTIPVRSKVETFPLEQANTVLGRMKRSELRAAAVLTVSAG